MDIFPGHRYAEEMAAVLVRRGRLKHFFVHHVTARFAFDAVDQYARPKRRCAYRLQPSNFVLVDVVVGVIDEETIRQ